MNMFFVSNSTRTSPLKPMIRSYKGVRPNFPTLPTSTTPLSSSATSSWENTPRLDERVLRATCIRSGSATTPIFRTTAFFTA